AFDHAADDLPDAVFHLARRLVGEGDGENFTRPGAAGCQDMADPYGQHAGLAGSGAGEHQDRAVERLDRKPLLRIEPGEIRGRRTGKRARGNTAGRGSGSWSRFESAFRRFGQGLESPRTQVILSLPRWHLVRWI